MSNHGIRSSDYEIKEPENVTIDLDGAFYLPPLAGVDPWDLIQSKPKISEPPPRCTCGVGSSSHWADCDTKKLRKGLQ